MNYEDIIQDVAAQMSSLDDADRTYNPQSTDSNTDVLNMIALEINRKGGY